MKEKTLYTCEFCHTDYASKRSATICEQSHKLIKKVDAIYKPVGVVKDGYPLKILVTFEDGRQFTYRR